jgi:F0F1-type ATP synthase membrane subunit c/vacuolar-type H+-ATPase subunit K
MKIRFLNIIVLVSMIMLIVLGGRVSATTVSESQVNDNEVQTVEEESTNNNKGIAMIAAALSTGLACLGAGIAVAMVASSAVGAISENPDLLGKTIIFAGLAEGIAIYGLIISIMILNQA